MLQKSNVFRLHNFYDHVEFFNDRDSVEKRHKDDANASHRTGITMKKSALFSASILLAFTGCGHGWLPFLNRGGSCLNRGCTTNAMVAPAPTYASIGTGCNDCTGVVAGYPAYESGVAYDGGYSGIVSDGYVSDGYIDGGYVDGGYNTVAPSTQPAN